MTLNQPFQHSPDALQSFNFSDFVEGSGVVKYYGVQSTNSSATSYILTQKQIYSDPIETAALVDDTDLDFDLSPYSSPQILEGTAIINYCIGSTNAAGSYSMAMTVTIKKVKGTTETTLVSTTAPAHGKNEKTIYCLQASIPRTSFEIGEFLRVTFTPDITADGESAGMGTDPYNRDGVTYLAPSSDDPVTTTKLEVYIPYEIDIE